MNENDFSRPWKFLLFIKIGRTSGLPGAMNYLYTYLWGQAPTPPY